MDPVSDDKLERYDQLQQDLNAAAYQDPERALAYCREQYFEPLGLGSGRIAIAVDHRSVMKVAWRERGLLDNQIEAELWKQAGPELKELLCPVLSLRESGVQLQARCLPTVGSALDPTTQQMITRLAQHGITDGAINLGFLLDAQDPTSTVGHIVCYDYALLRPETFAKLFPAVTNNLGSLPF